MAIPRHPLVGTDIATTRASVWHALTSHRRECCYRVASRSYNRAVNASRSGYKAWSQTHAQSPGVRPYDVSRGADRFVITSTSDLNPAPFTRERAGWKLEPDLSDGANSSPLSFRVNDSQPFSKR